MDASKVPIELAPFVDALELAPCRPSADGWKAPAFAGAPTWPLVPNAPPYDGVYRGSWISPGACLRFDLAHPSVPRALRRALLERFPAHVGADGAFYAYGIAAKSGVVNRQEAVLELGIAVASALALPRRTR